jgi:hypothetical protein
MAEHRPNNDRFEDRGDRGDRGAGSTAIFRDDGPEYATYEEGEAAFIKLLKRAHVQAD